MSDQDFDFTIERLGDSTVPSPMPAVRFTFLRDTIKGYFTRIGMEATLKYIDPSYIIRSLPANTHDSALCLLLGHSAVHAGMAGRTSMVVGLCNHQFVHVPIALATSARKKIDPQGWLWSSVLASTGQPQRR